jgi:cyanophycinase
MNLRKLVFIIAAVLTLLITGCSEKAPAITGKLFIIGGGEKSDSLMNELVDLAGVRTGGYVFILPMAGENPDSSIIWTGDEFRRTGIKNISAYNFKHGEIPPAAEIDSLKNARLIFISGGDQSRFMDEVLNTPVMDAIITAWKNGAVISGTSAGASVMSKTMITGNQLKHAGLESRYPTIETGNMELKEGLGLLKNAIIDQHFVKRQRLNRLIAISIENPGKLCAGIDESTAIIVSGETATVTGVGQVVVINNKGTRKTVKKGLLGTKGLEVSVYLPGDQFSLK